MGAQTILGIWRELRADRVAEKPQQLLREYQPEEWAATAAGLFASLHISAEFAA
jgi:hypothetical protein